MQILFSIAQTKSKIMRIVILSYTPTSHKTIPSFTVLVKPSIVSWLLGKRTTKSTFKKVGVSWVEYQPDNIRFKCDTKTNDFFNHLEAEMENEIARAKMFG